jgi:hypothetical protein
MNYKMLLLVPLTVPFVFILPACGSEFSGLCNKVKQCTLGNNDDQQAAYDGCVDTYEGEKQIAGDYSCSSSFSTFSQCLEASASCVSGVLNADSCSAQNTAYLACESAASALGHGTTSGGNTTTSTGTGASAACDACLTACNGNATCEEGCASSCE